MLAVCVYMNGGPGLMYAAKPCRLRPNGPGCPELYLRDIHHVSCRPSHCRCRHAAAACTSFCWKRRCSRRAGESVWHQQRARCGAGTGHVQPGCYNGFLAAALALGFVLPNAATARAFTVFGLVCVAIAGVGAQPP